MIAILAEASIRISIIAAAVGVTLWISGNRIAAIRHAVWMSVVGLMLMLPLILLWVPRARLAVLPSTVTPRVESSSFVADRVFPVSTGGSHARSDGAVASLISPTTIVMGVYVVGVMLFLGRLGVGTVYVRRLIRSVSREQGRAIHAACATPVTVGWWRSIVILPPGWSAWPEERRNAVLAHEDAHARRRDPLTLWIAQVNRAVWWFHPLAWWLEGEVTYLAERACDDRVIGSGHSPETYAAVLVAFAKAVRATHSRIEVGQLQWPGPRLARRVHAILSETCPPATVPRQLSGVLLGCVAMGLLVVVVPTRVHGAADERFEVASIKANTQHFIDLGQGLRLLRGETRCQTADTSAIPGDPLPRPGMGRCLVRNSTAKEMINVAYGLRFGPVRAIVNQMIVGGPAWAETDAFDIDAKAENASATSDQMLGMMRALLADRFHLRFHRERRDITGLALVIAKGGHKLALAEGIGTPVFRAAPVVHGERVPIVTIVNVLSQRLARPIVDETGLTGVYDFTLTWTPDPAELDPSGVPLGARVPESSGGSLTTALREQLGLGLETRRVSVDAFVIDTIEAPSPN